MNSYGKYKQIIVYSAGRCAEHDSGAFSRIVSAAATGEWVEGENFSSRKEPKKRSFLGWKLIKQSQRQIFELLKHKKKNPRRERRAGGGENANLVLAFRTRCGYLAPGFLRKA
jgi:hypothetical protein